MRVIIVIQEQRRGEKRKGKRISSLFPNNSSGKSGLYWFPGNIVFSVAIPPIYKYNIYIFDCHSQ